MWRNGAAYLLDMVLSWWDAVESVFELNVPEFRWSQMYRNAILKAMEIVGETAARISEETKRPNPRIFRPEITKSLNPLIHAYFEVSLKRVWKTTHQDVTRLIDVIEPLVPPETA